MVTITYLAHNLCVIPQLADRHWHYKLHTKPSECASDNPKCGTIQSINCTSSNFSQALLSSFLRFMVTDPHEIHICWAIWICVQYTFESTLEFRNCNRICTGIWLWSWVSRSMSNACVITLELHCDHWLVIRRCTWTLFWLNVPKGLCNKVSDYRSDQSRRTAPS